LSSIESVGREGAAHGLSEMMLFFQGLNS
jgi:hypothetical protein